MNPEAFNFNIAIDDSYIVVRWTRLPHVTDMRALSPYPELELRFNYRDISNDTVRAMLRDMEVPDSLSKPILTRIAANAT